MTTMQQLSASQGAHRAGGVTAGYCVGPRLRLSPAVELRAFPTAEGKSRVVMRGKAIRYPSWAKVREVAGVNPRRHHSAATRHAAHYEAIFAPAVVRAHDPAQGAHSHEAMRCPDVAFNAVGHARIFA